MLGTYQVQTNLSVQTMKISIWVIGSTSKEYGELVNLQSGPAFGLDNYIFANFPSHLSAPLPLDVDLMAPI